MLKYLFLLTAFLNISYAGTTECIYKGALTSYGMNPENMVQKTSQVQILENNSKKTFTHFPGLKNIIVEGKNYTNDSFIDVERKDNTYHIKGKVSRLILNNNASPRKTETIFEQTEMVLPTQIKIFNLDGIDSFTIFSQCD